jgi:hypothetical protein
MKKIKQISSFNYTKMKVDNLLDGNRITAAWLYSLSLELRLVPEERIQKKKVIKMHN